MKGLTTTCPIGIKYRDGILLATDTTASYGTITKFSNIIRTFKLTPQCIISYGGAYADIQALHRILKHDLIRDPRTVSPRGVYKMVQRILYYYRSKMTPLNVFSIIGGVDDNEKFLGGVNELGNFFEADVISTGLGAYIATPCLRDLVEKNVENLSREDAEKIIEDVMRLLFFRNSASGCVYNLGVAGKDMCEVSGDKKIETEWDLGRNVK